jgi:hypothetical protein
MGDLSQNDRRLIIESLKDVPTMTELHTNTLYLFQSPVGLTLGEIAKDLGRNPSSVRKRAKKMKLWMEKAWCVSSQGTHQEMWFTNPEGRAALEAWYGGNNG